MPTNGADVIPEGPEASASLPRVVGARIDTLYLAFDLDVKARRVRELEAVKKAADRTRRKATTDPRTGEPMGGEEATVKTMQLGGRTWTVKAYGASMAPYLLENDDAQLAIAPTGAPTLTVRLRAEALWREPTMQLVAMADRVARDLAKGELEKRVVQRIDIAVDFQGWAATLADAGKIAAQGAPLVTSYLDAAETNEAGLSPGVDVWMRGQKLTGLRVGSKSSPCVVRSYDKTKEILFSKKHWFRNVWSRSPNYDPTLSVWRLEVQLRREWLKQLRDEDSAKLETIEEVIGAASQCWRKVILEKVRLTLGDRSRPKDCTTNPAWQALGDTVELDGITDGSRVTRLEQDAVTAAQLLAPQRGYLAKWARLTNRKDLDEAVLELHGAIAKLCADEGVSFEHLMAKTGAKRDRRQKAQAAADARASLRRAQKAREIMQLERERDELNEELSFM